MYLGNLGGRDTVNVEAVLNSNFMAGAADCCFGGNMGLLLQKISGADWVFLNACGTIMTKNLAPGESIRVQTQSLVAFQVS